MPNEDELVDAIYEEFGSEPRANIFNGCPTNPDGKMEAVSPRAVPQCSA